MWDVLSFPSVGHNWPEKQNREDSPS